jgi:hypothetical protein
MKIWPETEFTFGSKQQWHGTTYKAKGSAPIKLRHTHPEKKRGEKYSSCTSKWFHVSSKLVGIPTLLFDSCLRQRWSRSSTSSGVGANDGYLVWVEQEWEREREIWVLGVFPLIWVWGKVKRGGKNLLFVFSNEQDPAWKFDDDEYFEMCVHEFRRDKMHIYHPIPTSRKLFVFLTSSRSRREERESDLVATKIR